MSIRKKILWYFSITTILLLGVALLFIYTLFAEYREEEFQQRQKQKITTTIKFLAEIRQIDDELIEAMDRLTINDLYDEKLLIFNRDKKLIYSSIDDTPIFFSQNMMDELSPENVWIEKKEGAYDVIGVYVQAGEKSYYGISKAYDSFGLSNLNYLKYVLIFTFLGISLIIFLISYYLSKKITYSIADITRKINHYDFEKEYTPIVTHATKDEIAVLTARFNELMKRMNDAFSFQKYAVHHISHELKTPIAVLVSNFERIEKETDIHKIKAWIADQKEDTKSLSEIIHSLLEIAKTESGNHPEKVPLRMDELIFDIAEELAVLYPDFRFSIEYSQTNEDENKLIVEANTRLLKAALTNLMLNAIQYSDEPKASILLTTAQDHLKVEVINHGRLISEKEKQFLFQHFFRGENSQGKRGFGLGLVFIHKILTLHGGTITYENDGLFSNRFTILFPLS